MATATLTETGRLWQQITDLQAKRDELRDQLYAIAGERAQEDRERAIMAINKQIDQKYFRMAAIELAAE